MVCNKLYTSLAGKGRHRALVEADPGRSAMSSSSMALEGPEKAPTQAGLTSGLGSTLSSSMGVQGSAAGTGSDAALRWLGSAEEGREDPGELDTEVAGDSIRR
mmetsp:Transcript_16947/g.40340  ORF Transcript_16947/g.40340 Transcript_16947/m.40340 type:complete len:103 (+) Transcript_16947:33-341(+)